MLLTGTTGVPGTTTSHPADDELSDLSSEEDFNDTCGGDLTGLTVTPTTNTRIKSLYRNTSKVCIVHITQIDIALCTAPLHTMLPYL